MSNTQDFVDLLNREMERLQGYLIGKKEPQTAIECEELVRPFVYKIEELTAHNYIKDQRIAELEEQLKNAIVPKFKTGDVLFYIFKDSVEFTRVYTISQFRDKGKEVFYGDGFGVYWNENELFATEEEAQAKLEELKGE